MVLGYGGFLGLDDAEYRQKLRSATTEDLQKQEVAKLRREVMCGVTFAHGAFFAIPTVGASLLLTPISLRKQRVAHRKRRMLEEELRRRGVQLHKRDWKDFCIPAVAFVAGCGLGALIDVGFGEMLCAGGEYQGPDGLAAVEPGAEMAMHLQAAAEGFVKGVIAQPQHIAHAAQDMEVGALAAGAPLQTSVAVDESYGSLGVLVANMLGTEIAEAEGQTLGQDAALAAEASIGNLTATQAAWSLGEAFEISNRAGDRRPSQNIADVKA